MNRKEKAKWFFIGMGVGWIPIFTIVISIFIQANQGERNDPFNGVKPDMGESVASLWRPSNGEVTMMPLGDSGFTAVVGPSYFRDESDKDWDYYTISVQKPDGNSSYVFFERQFKINEIPAELISKEAKDITTFNENSGVVTFFLGTSTHNYQLPNR